MFEIEEINSPWLKQFIERPITIRNSDGTYFSTEVLKDLLQKPILMKGDYLVEVNLTSEARIAIPISIDNDQKLDALNTLQKITTKLEKEILATNIVQSIGAVSMATLARIASEIKEMKSTDPSLFAMIEELGSETESTNSRLETEQTERSPNPLQVMIFQNLAKSAPEIIKKGIGYLRTSIDGYFERGNAERAIISSRSISGPRYEFLNDSSRVLWSSYPDPKYASVALRVNSNVPDFVLASAPRVWNSSDFAPDAHTYALDTKNTSENQVSVERRLDTKLIDQITSDSKIIEMSYLDDESTRTLFIAAIDGATIELALANSEGVEASKRKELTISAIDWGDPISNQIESNRRVGDARERLEFIKKLGENEVTKLIGASPAARLRFAYALLLARRFETLSQIIDYLPENCADTHIIRAGLLSSQDKQLEAISSSAFSIRFGPPVFTFGLDLLGRSLDAYQLMATPPRLDVSEPPGERTEIQGVLSQNEKKLNQLQAWLKPILHACDFEPAISSWKKIERRSQTENRN